LAQSRLGGVNRNIERRETLFEDSLEVCLRKVRQSEVMTKEEREPEILVLNPKSPTNLFPPWKLVDKAENAIVLANPGLNTLQFNSKILFVLLLDINVPEFSGGFRYLEEHLPLKQTYNVAIVEYVLNRAIVDRQEPIPRFDTHFVGN
jgi:hypothetical protein